MKQMTQVQDSHFGLSNVILYYIVKVGVLLGLRLSSLTPSTSLKLDFSCSSCNFTERIQSGFCRCFLTLILLHAEGKFSQESYYDN